jgi:hypothetical protein
MRGEFLSLVAFSLLKTIANCNSASVRWPAVEGNRFAFAGWQALGIVRKDDGGLPSSWDSGERARIICIHRNKKPRVCGNCENALKAASREFSGNRSQAP